MTPNDADTVTGRVKTIIFQNASNFFKILAVTITETTVTWTEPEIVVTGTFGDIKENETYVFTGRLISHPKYGQQFQAINYHAEAPTNAAGLISYLSSDKFPGIGPKTAEKIVDRLGLDAIDTVIKTPNALKGLGLSANKQAMLVSQLKANLGLEQVVIGLNEFGFTSNMAGRIYKQYQNDALDVIRENPYQLINDIDGIGFTRADQIAARLDIEPDAPVRLAGAIMDTLQRLTDGNGDTMAFVPDLLAQAQELLQAARPITVSHAALETALTQLAKDQAIQIDGQRVFPQRLFEAEWEIAHTLKGLADAPENAGQENARAIAAAIDASAESIGITYDDAQQQAIKTALAAPIFLLTGGPGTGKTTVTKGIVHAFAQLRGISLTPEDYPSGGFPIMLAAPTGRAAKRLSDMTGLPASTIHRLLGLAIDTQDFEPNELPDGLLIIDEMSMVDTYLFRTLLSALHPGIKIILVGDKDQLPSVGPGQVFADLLKSETLQAVALDHIHRQDEKSSIIPLAHAINAGRLPDDFELPQKDRSFFACQPQQVAQVVTQVAAHAANKSFGIADMQVLAPMYRGVAGIDQLNPLLQATLNPKKNSRTKEVTAGETTYRIGDKVLQLVNDPQQNIFNGEIGQITAITLAASSASHSDEMTVDFDGNEVTVLRRDWHQFTLAYATSIHKAQGSEFPLVILPLTKQSRRMLKRNLLYTAITRARDFLILVGEKEAFQMAVEEVGVDRHTGLIARLQTVFLGQTTQAHAEQIDTPETLTDNKPKAQPADSDRLTITLITDQVIDPMIGMTGVSPQQFMAKKEPSDG